LLFFAGYAWVLSVFLLRVPLIDLDRTVDAGDLPVFQVPHVGHFEGLQVDSADTELTYRLPAFVPADSTKTLEVFVAPVPGNQRAGLPPVRLTQDDRTADVDEARAKVRWHTPDDGDQRLRIETVPDSDDDSRALVAVRAHGASPWVLALLLTLAGLGCLFAAHRVKPVLHVRSPTFLPIVLLVAGMVVFWSAGLVSIDYFGEGHGRLSGMAIRLSDLATTGSLNATQYRPATFAIPALPGLLLEGLQLPFRNIVRVYPVTEYSLFAIVLASFGFLLHAWATRVSRTTAAVLAVLLATFYPFIHDTFYPDTDAFFIPLFAAIAALAVLWCRPGGLRRIRIVVAALPLLLVAVSLKATSLVFFLMVPALMYGAEPALNRRPRVVKAGAAFLVLLLFLPMGDWLDSAFQHPNRNVGVAGLPFQDSALWHVLWGGAGYFDHYTAFDFTASGGLRQERVAEALDVEDNKYLHQAQAATDEVYRPGVIRALREMPSIFYSNAFHRLQTETLRLYRYTAGAGGLITPWTDPESGRIDYLNGERAHPPEERPDKIEESIRLDRYWRIAPLALLVRIQQEALPQALDIALLALAVVGLSLVRVPGLRWFLIFGVLLQLAMVSGVHSLFRYGAFLSTCSLIGLATLLSTSWRVLSNRADLVDSAETVPN
jgi:hypothetical protein